MNDRRVLMAEITAVKQHLHRQGEKLTALKNKIEAGAPMFGKDGWIHEWNDLAESNDALKQEYEAILARFREEASA